MKFILLLNVKMPTIVGILTFISRINDWLYDLNLRISLILADLIFISNLNVMPS